MIEKSGGPAWVDYCLTAWAGTSAESRHVLEQGAEVYRRNFTKSVIHASCADYRAAAHIDAPLEAEQHGEGRRIGTPTLVLYSQKYLGARYDVAAVWREWISAGTSLTTHRLAEVGHYCFEEDPEACYGAFSKWVSGVLQVHV